MSRLIAIEDLVLVKGAGHGKDDRFCLLEAESVYDPEEHALRLNGHHVTDHPDDVSPVIGAFGRSLNDRLNDADRQLLKARFQGRMKGTNTGSSADERVRAYLAADWSVRTFTPTWLEKLGMAEEAKRLRDLPVIDSEQAARVAAAIIREVRDLAYARRIAAWNRSADAAAADAAAAYYAAAAASPEGITAAIETLDLLLALEVPRPDEPA